MLGCELGEGSANGWFTLAARSSHAQSATVAAICLTVFAVSEALARIIAGPLMDRLGRAQVTRISVAGSIGYFADIADPAAIGAIAQATGLLDSLWIVAALFLAALAAAGSLRPPQTRGTPGSSAVT